MKEQTIRSTAS